MSTPSAPQPEEQKAPAHGETSTDSPPDKPVKSPRSTTTMLAIFAFICLGLLLFLLIGEIGIFELGT
ncbi:hypothetical protein [Nesterenkonia haasae]|uniref:hypothetical protein n=1 Tax=Nesterenkonia haasae TaxID=2587813 RepID=UPI0013909A44|nr:hypothetical protein [Nesterenkonia haasae]NDK31138.1 hypothetical protein [Nesterenkonia haasae]